MADCYSSATLCLARRLLEMTAEFVAHRRQQLVGILLLAARAEAREQRRADDRSGNPLVDRRLKRPTTLARVGDPAMEVGQIGVLAQRAGSQVQQPRADDAAAAPHLGDLGDVDL